MMNPHLPLPLQGVVVVDATTDFAGQLCGRLLADAGASVSRVASSDDGLSGSWDAFLNLGKVRPRLADSQEVIREVGRLAMRGHVLLCTRPGSDDPRLDLRALQEANAGLLIVCIPPFGSGPYEAFRSDDLVLSALSGLADGTPGYPDRQDGEIQPPVQSLAPLAEFSAGLISAVATVAALLQRLTANKGPRLVEVSQLEAAVSLMIFDWGTAAYLGTVPGRRRKARTLEPNCFLPCQDGYVVVVATSDKHWAALVKAMGSPAWAQSPRFATVAGRAENVDDLHALLRDWAKTNSGRDLMVRAQERGVPCAALLELGEALRSEQVAAVGSLEANDGTPLPADPILINGNRRGGRFGVRENVRTLPSTDAAASTVPPLAGIRVVDLGQMVAGPFAGQLLSALGAEVLIVESRRRPGSRMFGPYPAKPEHDASSNFNHVNRGKRSVQLDLTTADGRQILRDLVRRSDIVLENFSRRAAQNLGLTYLELKAIRPDIIVGSISAFGRSGPWGSYVANHSGVTALTGLASVIRDGHNNPRLVGGIMPDVLTGTYMALAIVQALIARNTAGVGSHVELSMSEVVLNSMAGLLAPALSGQSSGTHPGRFFQTSEAGKYLAVDGPGGTLALQESIAPLTRRAAMTALQSEGLCAAAVLDLLEVIEDPHLRARGFVQLVDHPVVGSRPVPGVPWMYDGRRPPLGAAPVLGHDTDAVMRELAFLTQTEIDRLRESGVLR